MLGMIAETGGTVITASEPGIASARRALACKGHRRGADGGRGLCRRGCEWPDAPSPSSTVMAMTGAGLKSPPPPIGPSRPPNPGGEHGMMTGNDYASPFYNVHDYGATGDAGPMTQPPSPRR